MKQIVLIVFGFVFLFLNEQSSTAAPLKNVPKDWIILGEEGYESDPGIYLDLISGAQLKYDVGFAFAIGYWVETLNPFFKITQGPISFGVTEEGCWIVTLLMPLGNIKDGIAANFSACAHNSLQQIRITQLFMTSRLVLPGSKENTADFKIRWRRITHEQMSNITAGMKYSEVEKIAGPPLYGAITSQGFKVSYWPQVPRERCRHCFYFSVFFDSKAKVIETKREDEWWMSPQ